MACGGCAKRAQALAGLKNRPVTQAPKRVAVVTRHAVRSAQQVVRSTLPTRRGR